MSPVRLQTGKAAKQTKKVAQRAPTATKYKLVDTKHHRHHKHTSITLKKLNARLVARRRPDRRPRRPRSREVPPSGRRRHAAPLRLVLLVVREPRRR